MTDLLDLDDEQDPLAMDDLLDLTDSHPTQHDSVREQMLYDGGAISITKLRIKVIAAMKSGNDVRRVGTYANGHDTYGKTFMYWDAHLKKQPSHDLLEGVRYSTGIKVVMGSADMRIRDTVSGDIIHADIVDTDLKGRVRLVADIGYEQRKRNNCKFLEHHVMLWMNTKSGKSECGEFVLLR